MKFKGQFDTQAELSNCTFVKTVLMLVVVIYHCMLFWTGSWFTKDPVFSAPILSVLSSWMNSFHIYGFTLVSGYLFYFLKHEKERYPKFLPFAMNKAKRLLIPYAFVSIVWAIPFSVLFLDYGVTDIIKKFVLGTAPSQLWFLLMLFGVFLIFYPLSDFFAKRNILGAAVVLVIYGVGLLGMATLPNVFQIFRAFGYIPFFWMGFKIRQYGSGLLRKIPVLVWLAVDILLFVTVQFLTRADGVIFLLLRLGFEFVLQIVGALMAFVILQKIADRVRWQENRVFTFLSKSSMPVYLLHQQVIYVCLYFLNGKLNPYLHSAVNFAGAMLVSLLLSALLLKFKWTRALIGEK